MNSKINVLITGAGGAGSLGREIMKSLFYAKNNYNIFVTNSSALSLALFETKNSFVVPLASSPEYIEKLISICKTNKIDVVMGGTEPEIQKLADNLPVFTENGILAIDFQPNNEDKINVIGEKQYDNNAYVTLGSKYTTDKLGESLTSVTPLQIVGPVFINNEIYTFEIELRTIDNRDNWVYDLAGFHYQIIIQDDIILIESTIKE